MTVKTDPTDTEDTGAEDSEDLPADVASRHDQIHPVLEASEIDRLRRFGVVAHWEDGELMFEAGKAGPGMFVLLSGSANITRRNGLEQKAVVVEYGTGEFIAEVGQLSGRPALVDGRAVGPVDALVIDPESLRAVVIAEAELGERIMRALILRRVLLIHGGVGGPVLIDAPGTADLVRLQGFLTRNGHPHTVLDPAVDNGAAAMVARHPGPGSMPLVVYPDGTVVHNPSERDVARCLGLLPDLSSDRVYDVVIVGAGPAGLAAAVYASSEGLSVLVLDAHAIGGQAGSSSRIENLLGFPTGISGQALAGRAFVQAQKFGVDVAVPIEALRLVRDKSGLGIEIDDGPRLAGRTVIVASGATYRRPDVPNIAKYEGRGVYYWASPIEAKLCRQEEIAIVGGGNSAGQGVVFLASHASRVHLLVRGADLASSMSSYLVERISSLPNVTLHRETELVALEGDHALRGLRWRNRGTGIEESHAMRRVFLFIGADPNTAWLKDCEVAFDAKGFVLTGAERPGAPPSRASDPGEVSTPLSLETTAPGVFAIGDARAGSTKRVAAAIGEGAAVAAQVHSWIASRESASK
jgi:thioredoxin reductase (NADPH)